MQDRWRRLARRTPGRSLAQMAADLRPFLLGWGNYFRSTDTPGVFGALDEWLRHRLRACQLRHWMRGRTIFRELRTHGLSWVAAARVVVNARRWWHNTAMALHVALPTALVDGLGGPRLVTLP